MTNTSQMSIDNKGRKMKPTLQFLVLFKVQHLFVLNDYYIEIILYKQNVTDWIILKSNDNCLSIFAKDKVIFTV